MRSSFNVLAVMLAACQPLGGGPSSPGQPALPPVVEADLRPFLPAALTGADLRYFELRFRIRRAPAPGEAQPLVGAAGPPLAGVCRDDRLFVHFAAAEWPVPPRPAETLEALLAAVEARLERALRPGWFAEDAAGRVSLRPEARCVAVQALRDAVAAEVGGDPARVRVGRVCTFQAAQAECGPPPPVMDTDAAYAWHLDQLDPQRATPPAGRARIALIDGGFDAAAFSGEEHPVALPFGDRLDDQPRIAHGDLMAGLIRQIAPANTAELHGFRVLDGQGRGTTHDLAAAIAQALVDLPDDPLVVNLSLGWTPELGQDRALTGPAEDGGACATVENGDGEAVRHVLDAAWRRDRQGAPTAVFAATGNRAGRPDHTRAVLQAALGDADDYDDACWGDLAPGDAWFYPAEYGFTPTCGGGDARHTVDAIGASDASGRRSSIDGTTLRPPALVAPGEHVFAPGPVAVTGTSAATALTSAIAAVVQAIRADAPLSRDVLLHVLYATGVSLPGEERGRVMPHEEGTTGLLARERGLLDGPGASRDRPATAVLSRRLSLCRARAALTCAPGPGRCAGGLPQCVAANLTAPSGWIDPAILDACGACITACLAADDCVETPAPPAWSSAYADHLACAADVRTTAAAATEACDLSATTSCAFEDDAASEASVLGWVLPQPGLPGCEECSIVDAGAAGLSVLLKLNPKLPSTTRFSKAFLLVTQDAKVYAVDLKPTAAWLPGRSVAVTGIRLPVTPDWSRAKATLYSVYRTSASAPLVSDYSPLLVTKAL